jgi:hypothetical protein
VPPLQRALPLAEVNHVTEGVREHLDLNVPGAGHVPLDEQCPVAERGHRCPPRRRQRVRQLGRRGDYPHPFAAAAGGRLDEDGKPLLVQTAD